ncbi:pyruvate dehydrogenase complex dihydrolipoamide acetyltransferase [Haliangium sp.]|uniref:pyruvate dehydrogenase complex dihydrolipoamide acetyltransferase n=1 Tax=Haliangium sp. TaxID=2663208 RepID=UPI003D0DEA42
MAQIIGLPKLSPTMEEGVLVKWVKKEGDTLEPGDLVAEVETDKANMDFNIEDEGVLLKLLVEEGATVKLGAPVAIIGDAGEDIADLIAQTQTQTQTQASGDAAAAPAPAAAPTPISPISPIRRIDDTPAPTPAAGAGGRVLASPLAKTLAIELGIDLRAVNGTGPGGRIVERDVRATAAAGPAAATAAAGPSTALARVAPAPVAPAAPPPAEGDYEDQPLSSMRKTIARRLTEAKQTVPHFYLTRSVDASALLAFRKRLNELLGDRGKVSVNDLIIKGVALALRRVPSCNASFLGESMRYHKRVHIGVAVAIEDGLVTPVVRDADLKGIGVIAAEVRDLATRARERRLKGHEIQGSTFSVSNLGMFGIEEFDAIINPPEGGIVAVGAVTDVPVVKDGEIVIGKRMNMTMSCDHRVIDGALGATFLRELADLLESPESLAL